MELSGGDTSAHGNVDEDDAQFAVEEAALDAELALLAAEEEALEAQELTIPQPVPIVGVTRLKTRSTTNWSTSIWLDSFTSQGHTRRKIN